MEFRILAMIATVIEFCAGAVDRRRGHPLTATVRVLATLRQFLREGAPWRSLRASAEKASGSTLRRHLERWARRSADEGPCRVGPPAARRQPRPHPR